MNLENKKQFAVIIAAVALGLVASLLTGNHIQKSIEEQTSKLSSDYQKKSSALVNELETVKAGMRQMAGQQAALKKENTRLAQELKKRPTVIQQAAAPSKAAPVVPEGGTLFSLKTPPGKRALTILIDSLSAVGGLINAGDHVDIMGHITVPNQGKVTTVLFQDVQVMAVGTSFKATGDQAVYQNQQRARQLHVTLAVKPEEAGLLTFAQKQGNLQMILRRPAETGAEILEVASWEGLSEYVLDRQGTKLSVPRPKTKVKSVSTTQKSTPVSSEVKPFVEIFRGGR